MPSTSDIHSNPTVSTRRPWWTVDHDLDLIRLVVTERLTTTQAARVLSGKLHRVITKNMVIGRCYRACIEIPPKRTGPPKWKPMQPTHNPFPERGCCLWPQGHPDLPNFHFCGGDALPGKPYCRAHAAIAYVPEDRGNTAWHPQRAPFTAPKIDEI